MTEALAAGVDPPAVQALAVVRFDVQVAVRQTGPVRRLQDRTGGEVEKRVEERTDQALGSGGAGSPRPADSAACSRCAWSTSAMTFSGCETPRKAKSASPAPAVSKSTVPTRSRRSRMDCSVLTF